MVIQSNIYKKRLKYFINENDSLCIHDPIDVYLKFSKINFIDNKHHKTKYIHKLKALILNFIQLLEKFTKNNN